MKEKGEEKKRKTKKRIGTYRSFQRELISNPTQAELILKTILLGLGIHFQFQTMISIGNGRFRFVDFYFPKLKWIVEVDGEYHQTTEQKQKDSERENELRDSRPDYEIVRFTNDDIKKRQRWVLEKILDRITKRWCELYETIS